MLGITCTGYDTEFSRRQKCTDCNNTYLGSVLHFHHLHNDGNDGGGDDDDDNGIVDCCNQGKQFLLVIRERRQTNE